MRNAVTLCHNLNRAERKFAGQFNGLARHIDKTPPNCAGVSLSQQLLGQRQRGEASGVTVMKLEILLPMSIVLAGLAIGLGLAIGGRRIDARLERDGRDGYLVSDSWAGTVSRCSDIGMRSCTVMYPRPDH